MVWKPETIYDFLFCLEGKQLLILGSKPIDFKPYKFKIFENYVLENFRISLKYDGIISD